jgi:GT2 family glycosyltransferase
VINNDVVASNRVVLRSSEHPRVSIVITAWRAAPRLIPCLQSIVDNVSDVPYEAIVAFNAPSEALLADFERLVVGALSVRSPVNLGFAVACNRAAALARGMYIVFLNDDTEVEPGWLEALVKTADMIPAAGAVGSAMLTPEGRVAEAGSIVWRDGGITAVSASVLEMIDDSFDEARQVDYCSACSLLVRRPTWDAVGGFDEGYYPAYFEDVDLCFKIRRIGEAVFCDPNSKVRHHRGSSSSSFYQEFLLSRNKKRFVQRWSVDLSEHDAQRADDIDALRRSIQRAAHRPLASPRSSDPVPSGGPIASQATPHALSRVDELRFMRLELENQEEYVGALEGLRREREDLIGELAERASTWASRAAELEGARQTLAAQLQMVQHERDEAVSTVLAFRRRISVRLADKCASALHHVPGAIRVLRWILRALPIRAKREDEVALPHGPGDLRR